MLPKVFRPLLNAIDQSQAVVELRPDGTIVNANANFLSVMGYRLDEVRGRHHSIFVDARERETEAYRAFWTNLAAGRFQQAEFRRVARDGREVWIQATYTPVKNWLGRVVRVVKLATDVSDLKRARTDDAGKIAALDRSQAVIEFDLDGTILAANANFAAAVGYAPEALIGRHHSIFMPSDVADTAPYRVFWQALGRGEFQSGEFRRLAQGGREIWLQATYNPVFGPDGKPIKIVKFASDITAEKMRGLDAVGKLRAIDRSQAVIEFAPDGTIQKANEIFLACVGYRLDEIVGRHHRLFADESEGNSPAYAAFWAALGRGEFKSGEFGRRGKDGRRIWLQATYNPVLGPDGKPIKIVKFASDITEDVQRREQFHLLSLVANETSNSVIITDAAGMIEYVNPGFERTTGYKAAEVKGRKPGDLLQGQATSAETRAAIAEHLSRREPFYCEILNYSRDGQPFWNSLAINPVFGTTGQIERYVSIQTDITPTKQAALAKTAQIDSISANNALAEWSISDGRLIMANRFLDGRGVTSGPAIGLQNLLAEADRSRLMHGEAVRRELAWPGSGNEVVWLEAIFSVLNDIEGRPERILMCAVDITNRRRAMEQTNQALAEVLSSADQIGAITSAIETIAKHPTCWRSTRPSRRRVPARPGKASPSSPRRSRCSPRAHRPRPPRSPPCWRPAATGSGCWPRPSKASKCRQPDPAAAARTTHPAGASLARRLWRLSHCDAARRSQSRLRRNRGPNHLSAAEKLFKQGAPLPRAWGRTPPWR